MRTLNFYIVFLLLGFFFFGKNPFFELESSGRNAKSYTKSNVPKSNEEIFVNDFSVPLHIQPSKDSEILRFLPYGSDVSFDKEFMLDPNQYWLPIQDKRGNFGYVMRAQILIFPAKKKFSVISQDLRSKLDEKKISGRSINYFQLTDYLFDVVKRGEFTGNEYLFLKIQSGEALALAIETTPEEELDEEFLDRYQNFLTRSGSKNRLRFDENFFWKYASLNQSNPWGGTAGDMAIRFTPYPDCKGEPRCFLDYWNYTYLKYLGMFPNGKNRNLYINKLLKETQDFLKDPDEIHCYPPLPKSAWVSLERTRFRIQYLPRKSYKKMSEYLNRLERECFPKIQDKD